MTPRDYNRGMEIFAPFAGVVNYSVQPGDAVTTGQQLATVEAIKLEAPVVSPGNGIVDSLERDNFATVDGGDRILTLKNEEH